MIRRPATIVRAARSAVLGALLGAVVLLLSFAAAAARPVPPLTSPVIDTTGTLAAPDIARLEAQALSLQRRSGGQLQILMLSSTAPESIEGYAQRAFDEWKLGRRDVDDGLLIVVARDDRKVRIHTGSGLERVVTDAIAARLIQEYLVPKFRRGDYAGGLDDATLVLASLINGEPLPPPMAAQGGSGDGSRVVALALGLLAALLAHLACLRFGLSALPRLVLAIPVATVVTLSFGGGWPLAIVAAVAAILMTLIDGETLTLVATGRRNAPWSGHAVRNDDDFGGWSGGGSSGGWSGGGGSSSGGGASGGW